MTNTRLHAAIRRSPVVAASVAAHVLLLAFLAYKSPSLLAPQKLPGEKNGSRVLLTYSPGRSPQPASAPSPKPTPKPIPSVATLRAPAVKQPAAASPNSQSPATANPNALSGADALGTGNINIALVSYFPTPKPDLSGLPSGVHGDVVVDIVIDTAGRIADIKLTQGLGHGIDESVLATVHQWTFHPATRDGQPVASEQELRFHYEKA